MTGYGESEGEIDSYRVGVEILSLNSRFLDIFVTLPPSLESYELDLRRRIARSIPRGRLTVKVRLEPIGPIKPILRINEDAFLDIVNRLRKLAGKSGLKKDFDPISLLRIPGVLYLKEEEIPEKVLPTLWKLVDKALQHLNKSLREEGKKLEREIRERVKLLGNYLKEVQKYKKEELATERGKYREILTQGETQITEEKLVQLLSRLDVTEEVARIKSHLTAIRKILASNAPVKGRKLEFYCQELHREVTTLSQKSVRPEIVNLIVEMREEVERIKEQVRNIR